MTHERRTSIRRELPTTFRTCGLCFCINNHSLSGIYCKVPDNTQTTYPLHYQLPPLMMIRAYLSTVRAVPFTPTPTHPIIYFRPFFRPRAHTRRSSLKMATIEMREQPGRGRGVIASAPISVGQTVVRALPYAMVPNDDAMLSHCCVCLGRVAATAAPCINCKSAVLCTRCSASDRARLVHADECSALNRLFETPLRPKKTQSLRLLMRCLCARWRERTKGSEDQYVCDDGSWWGDGDVAGDDIGDIEELVMPPDEDQETGDEREEEDGHLGGLSLGMALLDMAKQARFYLDAEMRVSHDYAANLMGRLCCNSLTMYSREAGEERREVGVALSASVAMFNHDCEPSADWGLDDSGCLVVRTTRSLEVGEELCLSYIDVRLPAAIRLRKLRRLFFFECQCDACAAGLSAWSCRVCGITNPPFADRCATARCVARRDAHALSHVDQEGKKRKRG